MDLNGFTGPRAFDRAYRVMMERDAHAVGSVDRALACTMVRLCDDTANNLYSAFTPLEVRYGRGSRPELEAIMGSPSLRREEPEQRLAAILDFTRGLGVGAEQDLKKIRIGGTEEEIIRRKSDWCTDVARVACVMCQVAGFPCRIVNLFNLRQAYSGHVIVEAHRAGYWGALDSSTGVVYATADRRPASVWHLMNHPELIDQHKKATGGFYSTPGQFSAAAIANYFVWDAARYDYTVSRLNDYYFSILSMSAKGWPGGLKWLHGENKDGGEPEGPCYGSQARRT